MPKINLKDYLERLNSVDTEVKARYILSEIYSYDCQGNESAFNVSVSINTESKDSTENGWDLFYKMLEIENKYFPTTHIKEGKDGRMIEIKDHMASSYLAVYLTKPKSKQIFFKKNQSMMRIPSSYEDVLQDLWIHIASTVIPKWDERINNNFFAYLLNEIRTSVNASTEPEIPKYMQETRGLSSMSLEAYLSGTEDENTTGKDIPDCKGSIEDYVVNKIEKEEHKAFSDIILEDKQKLFSTKNIQNTIIASKLFGGLEDLLVDERCCEL